MDSKYNQSLLTGLNAWISKLRGGGIRPERFSMKNIAIAAAGGAVAIGVIAEIAMWSHVPLILGSFGASCVLLFGYPDSPFSQPRNVIGGHVIASLMGLICLSLFGVHSWSMALAAAAAVTAMHFTSTVHPPAGSNPVIVMLAMPGWKFLWMPTLLGSVLLVIVALFFINIRSDKSYPKYWI